MWMQKKVQGQGATEKRKKKKREEIRTCGKTTQEMRITSKDQGLIHNLTSMRKTHHT